jgi:membrane protein DedA with SNARE-associated domain/rhodanese-related sulfurtransferase
MPESLSTILKYGYESLFTLLFLEAVGFPVPGALVLLTAGAAAATHALDPGTSIALAISAMLLGDTLLYVMGRTTGWGLLGVLCTLSLNPETCIVRSAESFYRRGRPALLFAKFIPGINTMAPPLAGSMRLPVLTYLALDFCGSVLYVSAFWIPGFLFSEWLQTIVRGVQAFGAVIEWVVIAGIITYVVYRAYIYLKSRKPGIAPRIDVTVVHTLENAPTPFPMVIADVRSHGYYTRGALRIKGSVRMDPNALPAALPGLSKEKKYYLYCTCLREGTSAKVALELRELGFDAYAIVGGLRAWVKAGYPVEQIPTEELIQLPMFQ